MASTEATVNQDTDEEKVIDEAALDDTVIPEPYDITSYGADYDVEGVVRRLRREEIYIPPFQRSFMWNQTDASRFIESLLLGLPVPGIFLASDPETRRFLVIDGQQRLRSLQFFYDGLFNPRPHEKSHRVFKLINVQPQFEGQTYESLQERDRLRLDNSIIHATIVKQEAPADDDTSVFHIFERLNNGGRKLTDQEIRVALYHGKLIDAIKEMNSYATWREMFGPPSSRLKDQEFILRFFALMNSGDKYFKPMKEFLNRFAAKYRNPDPALIHSWEKMFFLTLDTAWEALGRTAFRPTGAMNAAVFDSVMVGLATRLERGPIESVDRLREAYSGLLGDDEYMEAISRATSDENSVLTRLNKTRTAFEHL